MTGHRAGVCARRRRRSCCTLGSTGLPQPCRVSVALWVTHCQPSKRRAGLWVDLPFVGGADRRQDRRSGSLPTESALESRWCSSEGDRAASLSARQPGSHRLFLGKPSPWTPAALTRPRLGVTTGRLPRGGLRRPSGSTPECAARALPGRLGMQLRALLLPSFPSLSPPRMRSKLELSSASLHSPQR